MMNYKLYFVFLFGSLAVSIGLQMLLPFPYGLGIALCIMIILPLLVRKMVINNTGRSTGDWREIRMSKVCTVCGSKSKGRECSRCGSHQFRMK